LILSRSHFKYFFDFLSSQKGAPDPALLNALVPGSVKVATMPEGTVFGEISLLRNAPRAATIMVASNYAHFLTLTRREWVALLRLDHRRSLAEKLDFFSTHDMFKSWPNLKLLSFVNCLRERHYQRGMSVFRAGDPSEFVYFIRRGDVAVCLSSDLINNTGAQTNTDDASVEERYLSTHPVSSDKFFLDLT
jgi:CRP-like cAMP-binding protein